MSSNREQALASGSQPNPSTLWLEWDVKAKALRYYDKEEGKNVNVPVPTKLIYLGQRFVVTGWDDKSKSRIYSNEVEFPQKEAVTVRCKDGMMISGIYKDIKNDIDALGGQGAQRIYALLDDQIVNITIKGDVFGQWLNFRKAHPSAKKEWINNEFLITGAEDRKKGGTKWTVPLFGFGNELTDAQKQIADEAFDSLTEYFVSKKSRGAYEKEVTNEASDDQPDDLVLDGTFIPADGDLPF